MAGKLFHKQLNKATLPSGEVDLAQLGQLVTSAYDEADRDRRRTDHSISLMIEELETLNHGLEDLVVRRTTELRDQNTRFEEALSNMSQGLTMFDSSGRLLVCNRRYMEMYRVSPAVAKPGRTLRELLQHRVEVGTFSEDLDAFLADFMRTIAAGKSTSKTVELPDGRIIVRTHRPMASGGWVSTHEDVTERHRAEKEIEHLARHDALTDLPNRTLFREELLGALARAARQDKRIALLYLDLDHFKSVNDSLGHSVGDELLKAAALRLRQCLRSSDSIARLGGDEFAVIQYNTGNPNNVAELASRICSAMKAPFVIGAHQIVVDVSVGIALAPDDGDDPEELLKNADLALYEAKAIGRGTYQFFEVEMDAQMKLRRALETDLRDALPAGQFELHYQPIVHLGSGALSGCEALIRWHHPLRGLLPPTDFIPICEEIGLIKPVGEWVLRTACSQASSWPEHVKVAVNLSAIQLTGRNTLQDVFASLASSGLAPERLEIEITEAVLLRDTDPNIATLSRIRDLGVKIVLDDFGTGYSALSYLRSFPFDKIKIDRLFVSELQSSEQSRAIVKAIAGLAATLGIASTAEGVETPEQLDLVRQLGCTEAQGYLLGRPMPIEQISQMSWSGRQPSASAA